MSLIKNGWQDAIQSAIDPRFVFEAFLDSSYWEGNKINFPCTKRVYTPSDFTRTEAYYAIANAGFEMEIDECVDREYEYQTMMYPSDYDDTHSDMEWQHLMAGRLHTPGIEFKTRMIQIAALAKSALMSFDRKFAS